MPNQQAKSRQSHLLTASLPSCTDSILRHHTLTLKLYLKTISILQVATAFAELLGQRVVRLQAVLAAVEQDAALARHGLTEPMMSTMLGPGLKALLLTRHSGPQGLQPLNLEATQRCAWGLYFRSFACSRAPITQVLPPTCSCTSQNLL